MNNEQINEQAQEREAKRDLFEQALKDRAAQLSAENGNVQVVPLWYADPADPVNGKPIIGYLKEPNRATKGSILDTMAISQSRAATVALNASLMKELSDARISSSSQLYDGINMQAGREALDLVKLAASQFKKK